MGKNSTKTMIHYSLFIIRKSKGFTLIELLWSVAIAAMLSAVGIAAFFTYSRQQALNSAVADFTTMLQVAKSRAQTQIKPVGGVCDNASLDGYKVVVHMTNDHQGEYYQLVAQCLGQDYIILNQKNNLPKGIRFDCISNTSTSYFFFKVLTGEVRGSKSLSIAAYGTTKTVSVSSSGVIQLGGSCVE